MWRDGRSGEAGQALTSGGDKADVHQLPLSVEQLLWTVGSLCALHRVPFDQALLLKALPPPGTVGALIHALRAMGLRATWEPMPLQQALQTGGVPTLALTIGSHVPLVLLAPTPAAGDGAFITVFEAGSNIPLRESRDDFGRRYAGLACRVYAPEPPLTDPDGASAAQTRFGLRWFVPELLKHRRVWRDVLLASLVLQLLGLGLPLFTQAIIDKVVVHRTHSTLLALGMGMGVFLAFSTLLTWVRQYLVLHTGNRVDAVLASAVFGHLLRLPLRYFERRPTGVIAARLQGVETVREFVSGAAVSLLLDVPFLLIVVALMAWYSGLLTALVLLVLLLIAGLSLLVTPVFREQLDRQFLLGARNQAFLTEHIAGIETVKSLQMEPRLQARQADQLAQYLHASFRTRQLANTYNTVVGGLEQLLGVLVLLVGAHTVMTQTEFTVGMLVAFQMLSGKLSQPLLKLVGLWQQFQQARLSVQRLGDLMDAPAEPYSLVPARRNQGPGRIEFQAVAFRHAPDLPYLYRDFGLVIEPGSTVAVMGPSGSGKSTLARLLLGFYPPSDGRILIDGIDIQTLTAQELRAGFGVVPQDTVLFSGTILDNLQAADPHASFDTIVQAARMARVHDAIEQLPRGYQTDIGERGTGLSGGQRQRLAIARALLRRPRVLVFDEATSALDPVTAAQFADTINQLRGRVTMLFITHALPPNLVVDRVVRIGQNPPASPTPSAPRPEATP